MNKENFIITEAGMIPEDWNIINLIDACTKIGSGLTPRGGEKVYQNSGVALIRSQNVLNNMFRMYGLEHINEIIATEMKNVAVEKGDILLNITGDSVGRCCIVPEYVLPARVNQHVCIIRTIKQQLNPLFLQYYLTSPKMQAYMLGLAQSGGTRNALTKLMIQRFVIPQPKLEEQANISKILSCLDAKIRNVKQINRIIEKIAENIFRYWFIDFEFPNEEGNPYKSSGGEMIDSGSRRVPRGWRIGNMTECIKVTKGCSYKSNDLNPSNTALVTLKSVNRGGGFNQEGYKEYTGKYHESQVLKDGDIIVAQTDLTQKAEVIGRPAMIASSNKYSKIIASLDLQIVRPNYNYPRTYIYFLLKTPEFHNHALSYTNGTTVLHLNKNAIPNFVCIIPTRQILDEFHMIADNILDKISANLNQIHTLSSLREALLPRLISGKIRVQEVR